MIISASYKTDIPTFYGEWFMNRLRAGYCKMMNPYNRRVIRVSLLPEDVEGIVFWTKNVGPFLRHLQEVQQLGFPFVLQHTINGYPRHLEQAVVDTHKSVENLRQVTDTFGPRVSIWRYDTIINSSLTPREFHIETFGRLAKELEGATDEVVIPLYQDPSKYAACSSRAWFYLVRSYGRLEERTCEGTCFRGGSPQYSVNCM